MELNRALLVIDVQNDFCEGGALAVPDTRSLIPMLNGAIDAAARANASCILTRDWHPTNHCSFREQGGPWPPHCVRETHGAAFADGLNWPCTAPVISKGVQPQLMGYSAFESTNLADLLREKGIGEIAVCGIALEYCVQRTALDARQLGWPVSVLMDLTRGIGTPSGAREAAIMELKAAGAVLCLAEQWMGAAFIPSTPLLS